MKKLIAYVLALTSLLSFVMSSAPVWGWQDSDDSSTGVSGTQISRSGGELTIYRSNSGSTVPMGTDNWTIFLYLCGSDLESDGGMGSADIKEILKATSSPNVNVVIETGGSYSWSNSGISANKLQRFIAKNNKLVKVDEKSAANMGKAGTLSDFLTWGVSNYPAEHMAVIFWDHGGGSITGVCFDERSNSDSLTLREIDSALSTVSGSMTDKFEFIGFDACLMATLETANILVPYARYMYASEEMEPGSGWDYTTILNYLAKHPDADGAELGPVQCQSYLSACKAENDDEIATFSIIDLSGIDTLLREFDSTYSDVYQSGQFPTAAKAAINSDNFGGNNRYEGYTNMVDLGNMLDNVSSLSSHAAAARKALDASVLCSVSGSQHTGATGLSLYYPLSVQGSEELTTFKSICPSSYYLAFIDKIAYGTTGQDIEYYDNSALTEDTDDIWSLIFDLFDSPESNLYDFDFDSGYSQDGGPLGTIYSYLDEDGVFYVQPENMDQLAFAACSVFMVGDDNELIWLGEDDNVIYSDDDTYLEDNFDGSWPCLDGMPLPIQVVSQYEDTSIYTCEIMLNDEETNLRIEYDWNSGNWSVIGAWDGIDDNGSASRDIIKLKKGDVITPIYWVIADDDEEEYWLGEDYTVRGSIKIEAAYLPAADYEYSMSLYDIYGNVWYSDYVVFAVDEDGEVWFYEDDDSDYEDDDWFSGLFGDLFDEDDEDYYYDDDDDDDYDEDDDDLIDWFFDTIGW